jgi:putative ubiquitin-RnfH superfamily antitoxin RatB of RatAB toxin-antitoxin module
MYMGMQMQVEVVYALPDQQFIISLEVAPGCTVSQALEQAQLSNHLPDLHWQTAKMGIFSRPATMDTILAPFDRIEIYRSLLIDPKAARRAKVGKKPVKKVPSS